MRRGTATLLNAVGEGLHALVKRPLRSLLTTVTVAVAIAVTVNVISFSYGMDADVRRDIGQFGRRTVDVIRLPLLSARLQRASLGPAEEARIRRLFPGDEVTIVPRRHEAGRVTAVDPAGEPAEGVTLIAAPAAFQRTLDVGLAAGRWWRADETRDVCVVDRALLETIFGADVAATDAVGRRLRIAAPAGARTCEVVGVLGDPLRYRKIFDEFDQGRATRVLSSSMLSFRNVYVPWHVPLTDGDDYTAISVLAPSDEAVDGVIETLRQLWPAADAGAPAELLLRGVGVFARRAWMADFGAASQTGALVGNIVWIIIVLVASVMLGTLNLISIRERYDELAIRRCVGARRRDVALQVTTESVVTALLGGLLGLPLGQLGAVLLQRMVDFPFRFEARYALPATGIAILLGLIASVVPARHAARLQPAQVLTRRVR